MAKPLGKLPESVPRVASETVKKVKKSKISKHHQMSPNVIKHRKTIQTSVINANFASNCLPEAVWVVVRPLGKLPESVAKGGV